MDTSLPSTRVGRFTARELPVEEWDRLEGWPLLEGRRPDPRSAAVLVVEDDQGRIVATWAAVTTVHVEGVYIDPAFQKRPTVVGALVRGMFQMLRAHQIPEVLTVTQTDAVGGLAEKLGGTRLGQLWLLPVPPDPTEGA